MEKLGKQDLSNTSGGVIQNFDYMDGKGTFKVYANMQNYYPDEVPRKFESDAIQEFKYTNDTERAVAYTAASNFNKDLASDEYILSSKDRFNMEKKIAKLKELGSF